MIVKTEAIVLNTFKYGDSSKIVTFFTKDFGKIKGIAKGSRKPKNKFGSSLEPLSYCNIHFYQKHNTDLYLLSDAELVIPLRKIQDSYKQLMIGLMIIESVNVTQENNDPNETVFDLLKSTLIKLNELKDNSFSLLYYFLINLSQIIGFAIDFSSFNIKTDVSNNSKIQYEDSEKIIFSFEYGTFVESKRGTEFFMFDYDTAKYLNSFTKLSIDEIINIKIDNKIVNQLNEFFNQYFSFHLERKNSFKTLRLFKTIL